MTRTLLAAVLVLASGAPVALGGDGKEPTKDAPKETPKESPKAAPKETPKELPKAAPKPVEVRVAPSPRSKREALRLLERFKVSVDFDQRPIAEAVDYLATVTGTNIILGPALLKEGGVEALKIDLRLKNVTARQVLEFLVDGRDLGIAFQSGVLLVTTKKDARGKPVLRLHALGDLLMPLTDFPAPDLMLHPAGAEKIVEPEEARKPAFGDVDEVIELIKKSVGAGTWEEDGVTISRMGDYLVVKQYEEFQDEVGKLLALLRATR